mgnify:CR=1 FL=1
MCMYDYLRRMSAERLIAHRRKCSREAAWINDRLNVNPRLCKTCIARDTALRYVFDRRTTIKFRPDALFLQKDRCIVLEYDEKQHDGYSGASEETRTMQIAGVIREHAGKNAFVFLRFNPDDMTTRRHGGPSSQTRDEMFDKALRIIEAHRPPARPNDPLCIYFFYDCDSRSIAPGLTRIHIRDQADICILSEKLMRLGWSSISDNLNDSL